MTLILHSPWNRGKPLSNRICPWIRGWATSTLLQETLVAWTLRSGRQTPTPRDSKALSISTRPVVLMAYAKGSMDRGSMDRERGGGSPMPLLPLTANLYPSSHG